jgi:hypothetical protein
MSRLMIALFVAAGLGYAGVNSAQTYAPKTTVASTSASMTKEGYAQAKKDADAQYKIDKDRCSSLSGNAKDICMAEAGADDIARAKRGRHKNTPRRTRVSRARGGVKGQQGKSATTEAIRRTSHRGSRRWVRAKADAKWTAGDGCKGRAAKQVARRKEAPVEAHAPAHGRHRGNAGAPGPTRTRRPRGARARYGGN